MRANCTPMCCSISHGGSAGVDMVVSCSGLLWVGPHNASKLHTNVPRISHGVSAGVDMVVGCNGLVWVGPHDASKSAEAQEAAPANEEAVLVMPTMPSFTPHQRAQAARVANAVRALAILYLPVHSQSVQDTCQV